MCLNNTSYELVCCCLSATTTKKNLKAISFVMTQNSDEIEGTMNRRGQESKACGGEAFDLRKVTAGEQKVLRRGVGVTHRWSYAIVTQESDFSPWCLSMLLCIHEWHQALSFSIVLVRALRGIIYLYICINVFKGKAAVLYSQFTLIIEHIFHRNMLQRKAGGLSLLFYFVLHFKISGQMCSPTSS